MAGPNLAKRLKVRDLWQLDAKDIIETTGEVRLSDRGGKNHQEFRGKTVLQPSEHFFRDDALGCPLLGKSQDVLFRLSVSITLFKTAKVENLLFRQPRPPTEGFVVMSSDVTIRHLRDLEVGKLS